MASVAPESSNANENGATMNDRILRAREIIFGEYTLKAIAGKPAFNDWRKLGLIHYFPGLNVIYDGEKRGTTKHCPSA
jgi:hypothetical protein